MKRVKFAVLAAVSALLLASATQSVAGPSEYYSRGATGTIRMKHSPTLGINIPIDVWIDGKHEEAFARGHIFERHLSPGRHNVYASRPGQIFSSFNGTLDVQPGVTYSFVVKSTPNHVYLVPVGYVN